MFVMLVIPVQSEKAYSPMDAEPAIFSAVIPVQFSNAEAPILVTEAGILIVPVSPVQFSKALFPIEVIVPARLKLVRLV